MLLSRVIEILLVIEPIIFFVFPFVIGMMLPCSYGVNSSCEDGEEEGSPESEEDEVCGEERRELSGVREGAIRCGGWETGWECLVDTWGRNWAGKLFISYPITLKTLRKIQNMLFLGSRVRDPWDPGGGSVAPCHQSGRCCGRKPEKIARGRGPFNNKEVRWARGPDDNYIA